MGRPHISLKFDRFINNHISLGPLRRTAGVWGRPSGAMEVVPFVGTIINHCSCRPSFVREITFITSVVTRKYNAGKRHTLMLEHLAKIDQELATQVAGKIGMGAPKTRRRRHHLLPFCYRNTPNRSHPAQCRLL